MTNKEPSSFVIDIKVLQHSSKRPFHLEQRMRFRKLQPKLTTKAAEINRNAFLDERRSKLAKKYLASQQMQNQHYKLALDQENNKKIQLNRLLESAEAKRHLIMATHAKSCAIAVMRAKEVARLHNLRTEKEREHRRIELDIRINRSSQRRNCILRKIGSKFTSSASTVLAPLEAALIIQRWWRRLNFTPMVGNFKRFDLSLASVQKLEFPIIAIRLKSKPLLKAAATLLIRSRRISPLYSTQSRYRNSVKVFMTSYLISVHPEEIVGEVNGKILSSKLCDSAKNMLHAFELWINSLEESSFYTNLHRFLVLWDEYYFDFETWRSSDVRKLVENMTQHFIELDMVWNKVRAGDQEEDEAWREEIIRQREDIKSQIRNIGGEDAVQELLDKQRLARQAHFEPLVSPSLSNPQSETEKIKLSEDSVMPINVESTTSRPNTNHDNLEKTFSNSQNILQGLSKMNSGFSNRQLAHEIIMNPDFKLASKIDPLTKEVKDIAKRAFFDTFREKIAANKADSMLISLLAEVRGKVIQLLPPRGHFSFNFESRFDMEILGQQISQNTFRPLEWIAYIGETLKSICAPIRDFEVSKITSFSDPVDAFEFIFELLDILYLDHLNFQIMGIRPLLTNQAVYYETTYFDKLLSNEEITLNKTQNWLDSTVQETRNAILARNPASVSEQSSWPNYESLFTDALITLLFSQSPISIENCPETLDLDINRLLSIQNEIQRLTVASALVVICQNIAGDGLRAAPDLQSELKNELLVLLNDSSTTLDNLSEHLANFLASRVDQSERNELPSDQKDFLINMVRKTVSYRDSVYLVLARRLQRVLKQIILSLGDQTLPSSATLASYGLGIVSQEILKVGLSIKKIAVFNRQVYAKHYDTILSSSLLKAMSN